MVAPAQLPLIPEPGDTWTQQRNAVTEAAGPSWAAAGVEPPDDEEIGGAATSGDLWTTPPAWWYRLDPIPGNTNIRIHPSGYLLNALGQKVDIHGRLNRSRGVKGANSSRRAGRDGPPEWDRYATGGGWGATGGGGGATSSGGGGWGATGGGGGGWGATGGGGGGQAPCTWAGKGSKGKDDGAKGPNNKGKGPDNKGKGS